MTYEDLVQALQTSGEDGRLSRGERKALRALLEDQRPGRHTRNLLRHRAFQMARDGLAGSGGEAWLTWLEDVVGLLSDGEAKREAPPHEDADAWFSPGPGPLQAVMTEMRGIRRSADICVFTITDDRLSDSILGLARRGVRVRVLSDDDKASDRGSDLARLAAAGIDVAFDQSSAHMHHKFAIFDDARLLTGSFNWTRSATDENHENLLATSDPVLVGRYAAEFDRLWTRYG